MVSGEHYSKTLPRLEMLNVNMTILEIKQLILNKVKNIYKDDNSIFKSDTDLNKNILLHIVDNLPYYIEGKYTKRKALCEFCKDRHNSSDTCDL